MIYVLQLIGITTSLGQDNIDEEQKRNLEELQENLLLVLELSLDQLEKAQKTCSDANDKDKTPVDREWLAFQVCLQKSDLHCFFFSNHS